MYLVGFRPKRESIKQPAESWLSCVLAPLSRNANSFHSKFINKFFAPIFILVHYIDLASSFILFRSIFASAVSSNSSALVAANPNCCNARGIFPIPPPLLFVQQYSQPYSELIRLPSRAPISPTLFFVSINPTERNRHAPHSTGQ